MFLDSMITDVFDYCDNLPKPVNMTFTQSKITDEENTLLVMATCAILFVLYVFCNHSSEIYDNQLYEEFTSKPPKPNKFHNESWRMRNMYSPIKRKYSDKTAQQELAAKRRRESLRSFKKLKKNDK